MKQWIALVEVLACSLALAGEYDVQIIQSNVAAQQDTTPQVPDTLEGPGPKSPAADEEPAGRQRAYLQVAPFTCKPCNEWKARVKELPFDVIIQVTNTPQNGEYPCFWFPMPNGQWKTWSNRTNGNVDAFLKWYHEETVPKGPVVTNERKSPHELRIWCNSYSGPLAYVRGMTYQHHICDPGAEAHQGEPFEPWQLAGLSTAELQKIHGAQHSGLISPYRE